MKNDIELANMFNTLSYWDTIGTDTQYRVLEEHDEVIIIFKESNSKADWRINFNFPKKPYKRMPVPFYVHGGFLKEWKKINDYFLKRVERINKPITIVGWSYGGALATLCYEDIDLKMFYDNAQDCPNCPEIYEACNEKLRNFDIKSIEEFNLALKDCNPKTTITSVLLDIDKDVNLSGVYTFLKQTGRYIDVFDDL